MKKVLPYLICFAFILFSCDKDSPSSNLTDDNPVSQTPNNDPGDDSDDNPTESEVDFVGVDT